MPPQHRRRRGLCCRRFREQLLELLDVELQQLPRA
jgi:hypothetical protein